ncbi:hypothetical protein V6N11_082659 [Hibiscus sabdariffa]|uniref:Uncharacterized protein n=1 Tax=Hibiscus sabdariffa TaxID=183260 RepID=A0ABR2P9C2_9ROSI
MVDVLEHSGSEVLTGFQSVQKKGRTCDAATITDGETMEVVEGVSSEKTGEFSGVTNRKRHASTVNHGFARGTKHNAANGGGSMVSDSGVDDKEVLGASPRRPILVTEENGVGTPLNATGQETGKGDNTNLFPSR